MLKVPKNIKKQQITRIIQENELDESHKLPIYLQGIPYLERNIIRSDTAWKSLLTEKPNA